MDDIDQVATALKALAKDGTRIRSKTARLRLLMPEIEALQKVGVSHEQILDVLNSHGGFDLKMGAYSTILWRIRHAKNPKTTAKKIGPAENEVRESEGVSNEIVSDIIETKQRREEKANRFISDNINPLLTNLKGSK